MIKGTFMKDGGMNRDPKRGATLKTWKRGEAQTIKKGPEHSPAKSDGMHGRTRGDHSEKGKVVHVHHHVHHHGGKK